MTTERSSATDEARRAAEGGLTDRLLERLVDRIGGRAGVQAVFGEPIERDGLTVMPVARARWGFGGAGSAGESVGGPRSGTRWHRAIGSGSGGGRGVAADPIGYPEIGPGGASFLAAALDVLDGRAIVTVEVTGIGLDEADHDRLEGLYRGTRERCGHRAPGSDWQSPA